MQFYTNKHKIPLLYVNISPKKNPTFISIADLKLAIKRHTFNLFLY